MKIYLSIILMLIFVSLAHAQKLQTAKGALCGMEEGDSGYPSLRIGKKVETFAMLNDEPKVKYMGLGKRTLYDVMGAEVIIGYAIKTKFGKPEKVVRSLTVIGPPNKKIKSC